MVIDAKRDSRLYDTLSQLGLLYSPQGIIDAEREKFRLYSTLSLSNMDVHRACYVGPHFMIDMADKDFSEIWIDDEYINPKTINWIDRDEWRVYGILPKEYDIDSVTCKVFTNHNIIHRYTAISDTAEQKAYTFELKITDIKYSAVENFEHAFYFIGDGVLHTPNYTWLDDTTLRVTASYITEIDFFMCSNLVHVDTVTANTGKLIDYPTSKRCYYSYIVDNDDMYPIKAAFYPYITVDKDCIIRVFDDHYSEVQFPYTSRLMLYPEFLDVEDPYNTNNEYLSSYAPASDFINAYDDDFTIFDKFSRISSGCYRMWETLPFTGSEESDFLICDNSNSLSPTFKKINYTTADGPHSNIISITPYEEVRDILFYDGMMFSDYQIITAYELSDGSYEVNTERGHPTYVIPDSYDSDKFTLVKFNVSEDSSLVNVNEYLTNDNLLELHHKVNRFYRNLMILKDELVNMDDTTRVRVSSATPDTYDDNMWFELLVHEANIIEKIDVSTDPIPESIRAGLYRIDTEADGGSQAYYEALMTFMDLGTANTDKLVFHNTDSTGPECNISVMMECTGDIPSSPVYDGTDTTMVFDYGDSEIDYSDEIDNALHRIYGSETSPDIANIDHNDIWVEFLDTIKEAVVYSDTDTMILRVDNHLYGVEFSGDIVNTFVFDDIILNFKNTLGVKYQSIVSDLINSGVISNDDTNIFYHRLITKRDSFDPGLKRLYTGTSNIVSMAKVNTPEYAITYSTNIGRLRLDYDTMSDDAKASAYRMQINYSDYIDFAFISERMLLFVNGKYIPRTEYKELCANKIELTKFHEIITTVDIFYSKRDTHLMKLKRLANHYWQIPDASKYITDAESYGTMQPIELYDKTYQGYYDVFINEYIANNRLVNTLKYLADKPDEFEYFKTDLINKFREITDDTLLFEVTDSSKIVLPLGNNGDSKYVLK